MKPLIFAGLGIVLYASSNVLLEQKLSKYNNMTLIICYSAVVLVLTSLLRLATHTGEASFNFPTGWAWAPIIGLGLILTAADYFYISAYTSGGNLTTITCIVVLLPVISSVMKMFWVWQGPNLWQWTGYALAATSVLLIAKGNMIKG